MPPTRLPPHPLVSTDAAVRARHARGQSLPDWYALRFGRLDPVPDGVAFPESSEDVAELLAFARGCRAVVVPYGGGTSVVGGVTPPGGDAPVLTIALERLRRLLDFDRTSLLARFGAGVSGPDLEAQLAVHGVTLGHFPQSFEYSTLGGWVVTRSCGQQSLRYGRIESLFAGGRIETPVGAMTIPTFPASAAGIDVRGAVLGSEGRLGIVTEAAVRVRPVAERESFHAIFFPDWPSARECVRALAQSDLDFSMLRTSNPMETFTTLRLAGGGRALALLERYLALRGAGQGKAMLIAGVTGTAAGHRATLAEMRPIVRRHGGVFTGTALGERWKRHRFSNVYLRNALWEQGYAIDTVETAVDWPRVDATMLAVESAAAQAFGSEPVHAYTHLSHVYREGSSVYSSFIFRIAPSYEENLARWQRLKHAVSEAIVRNGGTITHQHGIGTDHRPYLPAEKGALGMEAMRALFTRFDPDGTMNPGALA